MEMHFACRAFTVTGLLFNIQLADPIDHPVPKAVNKAVRFTCAHVHAHVHVHVHVLWSRFIAPTRAVLSFPVYARPTALSSDIP